MMERDVVEGEGSEESEGTVGTEEEGFGERKEGIAIEESELWMGVTGSEWER